MPGNKSTPKNYIILLIFVLAGQESHAGDYHLTIAPAEMNVPSSLNRVDIRPGFWNQRAFGLADAEYEFDDRTELLLEFNDQPDYELSHYNQPYGIMNQGLHIQGTQKYRGEGSALVIPGNPLTLQAGQGSMFSPGEVWNDFSMEFWMYPAVFTEEELLFEWKGTSWLEDIPFMQDIVISADEGKLRWEFRNLFILLEQDEEGIAVLDKKNMELTSRSEIIPRSWSHHMIRYDSRRGLLEYLLNGVSEALVYVTSGGLESGASYLPYVGEQSQRILSIAPSFHGFLDDFRISRRWIEAPSLGVTETSPGYAVVGPVDLEYDGIVLTGLDATYRTPGQTDVVISVAQRDAYNPLAENEYDITDSWRRVAPGSMNDELIPNGFGRYLYFRVDFLPDGTEENIPILQDISITYERDPAPPAPLRVTADSLDGAILLKWAEVLSQDVEGYLLYFGEKPNHYFGAGEVEIASPVDLGNADHYRLEGLENGKMYYFKLASYNRYNNPRRGLFRERNFSEEVNARPSRLQ